MRATTARENASTTVRSDLRTLASPPSRTDSLAGKASRDIRRVTLVAHPRRGRPVGDRFRLSRSPALASALATFRALAEPGPEWRSCHAGSRHGRATWNERNRSEATTPRRRGRVTGAVRCRSRRAPESCGGWRLLSCWMGKASGSRLRECWGPSGLLACSWEGARQLVMRRCDRGVMRRRVRWSV